MAYQANDAWPQPAMPDDVARAEEAAAARVLQQDGPVPARGRMPPVRRLLQAGALLVALLLIAFVATQTTTDVANGTVGYASTGNCAPRAAAFLSHSLCCPAILSHFGLSCAVLVADMCSCFLRIYATHLCRCECQHKWQHVAPRAARRCSATYVSISSARCSTILGMRTCAPRHGTRELAAELVSDLCGIMCAWVCIVLFSLALVV
jgi:hypothetical protein